MPNALQGIPAVVLLLAATILEASGDAVVRLAIYDHVAVTRLLLFLAGAALLFGYGCCLNLAPLEFGQVVGLYIATLLNYLWPTWDAGKQALHDKVVKTRVVRS